MPDEATLATIKSLAGLQCTQIEAASVLGVAKETFNRFLNRNPEAREVWDMGHDSGKASIRRTQFKIADGGNAAMAIWLGKMYLGQSESLALTGKDGGPIETRDAGFAAIARALDGIAAARAGGSEPPDGVAEQGKAGAAPAD